jgi:hypothetical protein
MVETLPYQKSPANNGERLPVDQARLMFAHRIFIFFALFPHHWRYPADWQSVLLDGITIDNKSRKSMVIPMKSILKSFILGLACTLTTFAPFSGLSAQTMTGTPASQVSPEKLEVLEKLGAILNEQQKGKLEAGLAQGQEIKAILPTLDLSPQQKIQVLKVLESVKK